MNALKKFLYKCRKTLVLVMGFLVYVAFAAALFGLLSINNPWVIRASRTAAIMLVTFFISMYLLGRIYGRYDIDVRKSKPVIISLVLSVFVADLLTFVMMVIMNTNSTTNNEMYDFFGQDILWCLLAYVIQIALAILLTYGGNRIYFGVVPPERCLIISAGDANLKHLSKGIAKYKKQYTIAGTIDYRDEKLPETILEYDAVFLNELPYEGISGLVEYCFAHKKNVYRTMDIPDLVTQTSIITLLGDESVISSVSKEKSMHQRVVKRLGDIVISALGLIVTSPLLLVCALAIKLEDGGHVIFTQNRVTTGGRFFKLYKLRTMKENASDELVTSGDNRITRAGSIIRKFRIDEIPQFVNVLKGDMSVVGPRAEMADRVYMNVQEMPEYFYRYRIKAGITGYAQIHGKYNTSAKDKLMLDLTYIQTFSLWNDVKILFQTLFVLLTPDDSTEAYDEEDEKRQERITRNVENRIKNGEDNE